MYYVGCIPYDPEYLRHYGTKGMRWGVRHWQYADGRFNEAGKIRYFGATSSHRPPSVSAGKSRMSSERSDETYKASSGRSTRTTKQRTNKVSSGSKLVKEIKKPSTKKESKSASKEEFWTEDRKNTAKKAAVVAGIVAASVIAYKVAKPQLMNAEAGANFIGNRYASQMSRIPISKLSDDDTVLQTGIEVQRIIRDYNDPAKAMAMDSSKSFIYGSVTDQDKQIYRALFRSKGQGRDMITTRKITNDLLMPSPQKRVKTFVDSFDDRKFAEAFASDMKNIGQLGADRKLTADKLMAMTEKQRQSYYSRFYMFAGDSRSESAKLYFDTIKEKGYHALVDDNDGGYLSEKPIIFLHADTDTVVTGKRYASKMEKYMDGVNLKHIYGISSFDIKKR